ncbi:MAG: hypothetical protein AMJ53_05880 [Gammaproteobacteria bacterium SG8_11]|nr:MAG: hypothetical protein AMJ53_05880 [Gammaproteobacteria bacterium SG8_11]
MDKTAAPIAIDLSEYELERHVRLAFRLAVAMADGETPNAKNLLCGAVLAGRDYTSEAFSHISNLLQKVDVKPPDPDLLPPEDIASVTLSEYLAKSYAVAKHFFETSTNVWGRDYITFALLAIDDPSLTELAMEAGTSIEELQYNWFQFISGDKSHRKQDEWKRWWKAAGAYIPPASYLFTWNPDKYVWANMDNTAREIDQNGFAERTWSTGARREVYRDDRVYLMRQGKEPGIVGFGVIVGEISEQPHWDEERRKKNETYWCVPVRWSVLAERPILTREELEKGTTETDLWKSQAGGVEIKEEVMQRLEPLWEEVLKRHGLGEKVPEPTVPFITSIAKVNADSVYADAVDHLDVEREAHAFARVAASGDVVPPLSIGVFGEWGSGKTFIMEKIYAHVEALQQVAREAKESAYLSRIVQIRFNAWHYMDSNLWASLVDHIFVELDKWLLPKEKQGDLDILYEQLSTARMLKLEAVEKLIAARSRRQEAEAAVAAARQQLASTQAEQDSISSKDFWQAVVDTLGESVDAEKEKLVEASEALGFKDVQDSAKELREALVQARDQMQRSRLLTRSLISKLGNGWWVVALIIAVVIIPMAMPALMDLFASLSDSGSVQEFLKTINSTALSVSSAVATFAAWVGAAVSSAKKALNRLNSFQNRLDLKLKEQKDKEVPSILQVEQTLAQRRKDVELAETNLETADQQVEQARGEFSGSARSRLNRFIRDKIVNGDYAKHLGIIATIRKDFDQLTEIMSEERKQAQDRPQSEIESDLQAYQSRIAALNLNQKVEEGLLTDGEKALIEKQSTPSDKNLNFFQRIILYIDDLDRCPPDKVVEVLQACHLLLCFPLFIVVVAVDARWVSKALSVHYKELLQETGAEQKATNGEGFVEGAAQPRDYLEKIFQIPYWVRRMHGDDSKNYAHELIGAVMEEVQGEDAGEGKEGEGKKGLEGKQSGEGAGTKQGGESKDSGEGKEGESRQAPEGEAGSGGEGEAGGGEGDETKEGGKAKEVGGKERDKGKGYIDPLPKSLQVSKYERDFLAQLAPFAGLSPRTIKRYVNVYRILRTGLSEESINQLVGKKGESLVYKAILGQLAIVTGAPSLADKYFQKLGPQAKTNTDTPSTILAALEADASVKKSPEWPLLKGALDVLIGVDNSAHMLAEMRERATVVKRYSFSARPYL